MDGGGAARAPPRGGPDPSDDPSLPLDLRAGFVDRAAISR